MIETKNLLRLGLVVIAIGTAFNLNAQKIDTNKVPKEEGKQMCYRFDQFVMITMKDGTQIPARVSSVKSKKQYWVRMWGGNRRGLVKSKYMRAMTSEEIANLKKKNPNNE